MRKPVSVWWPGAFAAACVGAMVACGSADLSSLGDSGTNADGGEPFGEGGAFNDASTPAPGTTIESNAIVLVHAASFPAFRICFDGLSDQVPMPSVDLLPDSNVLGVDVGTAIRLPPTNVMLGKAYVFPEPKIRPLYPTFGGSGPKCKELLGAQSTDKYAVAVGEVNDDLSSGVHALVLTGCLDAISDPVASVDRCGSTWSAGSGNLSLQTLPLTAYADMGDARLSVQLLQLSPSLEHAAQGRALGLGFGSLDAGGAPVPFVEGDVPFAKPVPTPPAIVQYNTADLASYATSGVFLTLGGALDDAGDLVDAGNVDASRDVLLAQSLAEIQQRSSPRALPSDWFNVASSYVLLTVGDPDPRLGDGGKDTDIRRSLHFLAIPLAPVAMPDAGGSQ